MNETKATRYQRLTRRAHAADAVAGAVLLALLALTPASRAVAGWARSVGQSLPGPLHAAVAAATFVGLVVVLWEAVALPAVLYLGLSVDRRFRKTDHSVEGLVLAQAQATAVALVAALVASAIVLGAVRLAGAFWWGAAGAMLALALAGALRSVPLLLPMLGPARPIARRSLMSGLRELARRSGVPVSDILEWRVEDGGHATALVTGTGRTCRVFVASGMLRDWSDDEIAVVVAHELAHHVYRDLWRTLALDGAVLSLGLWVADRAIVGWSWAVAPGGAGDLATLPLIALVTAGIWVMATPLRLAQSRAQERRADRFALRLTGGADAFGAAVRRLSVQHLAEERPSTLTRWLFHRHPPVAERLALAEAFRRPDRM